MKVVRPPFTWLILIHDFNTSTIRTYDILRQREDFIKKLKKKYENKEDFAEALRLNFQAQFWSRSEYEMILYIENNRVYLEPWTGTFKESRIDITNDSTLDWLAFAQKQLDEYAWHDAENDRDFVKFDVYSQIMFRFDELINFVWNYRHKYQRINKEVIENES